MSDRITELSAMKNTASQNRLMKDSGIDWLGQVPVGWGCAPLKYTTNIQTGYAFSSEDFSTDGIPLIRISDITKDGCIDLTNAKYLPESYEIPHHKFLVVRDAILMAMTGATIGKAGKYTYDLPAYLNQRVCSFSAKEGHDQNFLWYILNADFYFEHIALTAFGGAQPNISDKDLLDCTVVIPPLPEQTAIADYLDHKTGQIDLLIAKKQRLIALLKEKRTALISRTVTRGLPDAVQRAYGLTPHTQFTDSGIPWLGEVPVGWGILKLNWLFAYTKGKFAATLTKQSIADSPGHFPVFSGQTENDGLMGCIDSFEFEFEQPVIFVTTVGAKAMTTRLVSGKFSLSQNCALIMPTTKKTHTRFCILALQCLFNYERRSISLIMQPSLRFEDLNKFWISLPPLPEQTAIADYLDRETDKIDRLMQKVETAILRLQEYRTALITQVVTGKIDVRTLRAKKNETENTERLSVLEYTDRE